MKIDQLLFVGLNGRVAALERTTGEIIWEWKSDASYSAKYVTLLVDRDLLFVSVDGYTYCLDPLTGEKRWYNPLTGYGVSPTSLATVNGRVPDSFLSHSSSDIRRKSD